MVNGYGFTFTGLSVVNGRYTASPVGPPWHIWRNVLIIFNYSADISSLGNVQFFVDNNIPPTLCPTHVWGMDFVPRCHVFCFVFYTFVLLLCLSFALFLRVCSFFNLLHVNMKYLLVCCYAQLVVNLILLSGYNKLSLSLDYHLAKKCLTIVLYLYLQWPPSCCQLQQGQIHICLLQPPVYSLPVIIVSALLHFVHTPASHHACFF